MPSPQFVRNIALAALLAGAAFLAANLYLDATGHASLAKTSFMLAILSDGVFVVAAVLWGFLSAWARESAPPMQRPTAPMPGGPMPGGKMPGGLVLGGQMPGGPNPGAPMIIKPDAPAAAAPPAQKPRPPQP
jgi:hypothetical protein